MRMNSHLHLLRNRLKFHSIQRQLRFLEYSSRLSQTQLGPAEAVHQIQIHDLAIKGAG
jgi:hypothetical protein